MPLLASVCLMFFRVQDKIILYFAIFLFFSLIHNLEINAFKSNIQRKGFNLCNIRYLTWSPRQITLKCFVL